MSGRRAHPRRDVENEARRLAGLGTNDAQPREPKGRKTGGRWAEKVSSESEITLEETGVAPGYEPDGSKAFEERMQQREAEREQDILAELERSLKEAPLADQPMGLVMDPPGEALGATPTSEVVEATPPKIERPVIKLGGNDASKEGSWIFPPTPTSDVMKLANYWATVQLEDGALVNVERADRLGRDLEKWRNDTNMAIYFSGDKWPRKRRKADPEGWQREMKRRTAVRERGEQVAMGRGLMWPHTQIRDMVRIGAFWCQIQNLAREDREKASAIVFEMSRGERITAAEAAERWGLDEIRLAFFNRWVY